ncbi:hypothetical protein CSIM01_11983 [Colletotrichum simmondsii]|uniref:Uncharacterized protein n=1 Tax=Colletotrichum simmondsii TaxID=703756 RepID=A0A135T682_9PEZI|nr:hypothetical protein CSIM01_11983 [Colletotrichum simmondsii]
MASGGEESKDDTKTTKLGTFEATKLGTLVEIPVLQYITVQTSEEEERYKFKYKTLHPSHLLIKLPFITISFSPHHNTLHYKPSPQSSRLTSPNPPILKMKSFTVMAIALLGLTNAATIRICKDQTLGNCVTMDVGSCSTFLTLGSSDLLSLRASVSALRTLKSSHFILANFPGNMNDVVSSVDTGSATCTFFTCGGASWTTRGLQNTVPSNFNDNLSSVRC